MRLRLFIVLAIIVALYSECAYCDNCDSTWCEFYRAMLDAVFADETEVCKNLWPISAENKQLKWKDGNVLAVTWASSQFDIGPTQTKWEWWVTAVPELKHRIKELTHGNNVNLDSRLEKLIGLRPNSGKKYFVEIWVNPKDLFRPCPDAEITDTLCSLDFLENTDSLHKEWINKLRQESYHDKGYPWTRLGYTYDWAADGTEKYGIKHRGVSEFTIKSGSNIIIHRVYPTKEILSDTRHDEL